MQTRQLCTLHEIIHIIDAVALDREHIDGLEQDVTEVWRPFVSSVVLAVANSPSSALRPLIWALNLLVVDTHWCTVAEVSG